MVGVFGRSLSFPNKNPNRPPRPTAISHHTRSVSLPVRSSSHPLVSQLKDSVSELELWSSSPPDPRTSSWLCAGLARLRAVHESIDDVLHLPQTLAALSQHRELVEDLLRLVDAYGIFCTSVLALKEELVAARVALRRKDEPRVGLYLRAVRKISREIHALASTVQPVEKASLNIPTVGLDAELIAVILSGVDVTVKVSVALFNGVSASFAPRRRQSTLWTGFRVSAGKGEKKKEIDGSIEELREANAVERLYSAPGLRKMKDEDVKMALRRMQEMESCIGWIESGSEGVFRRLISTRVSLLNSLAL